MWRRWADLDGNAHIGQVRLSTRRDSTVEWVGAGVASLVVVALFWGPGLAFLRALGVRGTGLVAWAPLATLGILGGGASVVDAVGLRWGAPVAGVLVAVAVVAAWVAVGGRTRPAIVDTAPLGPVPAAARPWLVGSVVVGVVVQIAPLIVGMGRPGRMLIAHDIAFHVNAIARVRGSGSASSLTLLGVDSIDGSRRGFYGAAWHSVMALAPAGIDAGVLFNVGAFLPAALAWTTGLVALTQRAFPCRPRAWCWAAVLSSSGIAVPFLLVLRPEGMVPNSLGVALVPGIVALCAGRGAWARRAWWPTVAVCLVGLGLTHTNAVLSAALVLAGWWVPRARDGWKVVTSTPRRRVAACAVAAATVGVAAAVITRPQLAFVVSYPQEGPVLWWEALAALASGNTTGMGWASGLLVMAAAGCGALLARRLPSARPLVGGALAMVLLYLLATSSVPMLTEVDRPWYGEPRRFAPALAATMVPLAALAIDSGPRWLVASGRLQTSLPRRVVGASLAALLVVVSSLPAAVGAAILARRSFVVTAELAGVADDAERDMMTRLSGRLEPGRSVLGSAFSGAAHLHALVGADVVLKTALTTDDRDLTYIREHLAELGADTELCGAIDRLRVGYLYVDPRPWNSLPGHIDVRESPAAGVVLLDEGGGAQVYEITACT